MQHGQSRLSRSMMTGDIVGKLLETLRPIRHLLTRALAHIPIAVRSTDFGAASTGHSHGFARPSEKSQSSRISSASATMNCEG
jgi:hypothetical protein